MANPATAMKVPTAEQERFMRDLLRWQGVAHSRDLHPQVSHADNNARATCKRRGWVTYDGHYWRMTDAGREIMRLYLGTDIT